MTKKAIAESQHAIQQLAASLDASTEFSESLAADYQRCKRLLAHSFQSMSVAALDTPSHLFSSLCEQVTSRMQHVFGGEAPSNLLHVGTYGVPHPDLYDYLSQKVGTEIPAWRLRMLTADAVHTERRVRGLTELGLTITNRVIDGEHYYKMQDGPPDFDYAAALQLRTNVRKNRRISSHDKGRLIALAESHAVLPALRGGASDA